MPKMNELYPSAWISAEDLEKPRTLRIKDVQIEEVGQNREEKPVMSFVGTDKKLILNKTNAGRIQALYNSDDTDDWKGKKIVLGTELVSYAGKTQPGVRVLLRLPDDSQQQQQPQQPQPEPRNGNNGHDPKSVAKELAADFPDDDDEDPFADQ